MPGYPYDDGDAAASVPALTDASITNAPVSGIAFGATAPYTIVSAAAGLPVHQQTGATWAVSLASTTITGSVTVTGAGGTFPVTGTVALGAGSAAVGTVTAVGAAAHDSPVSGNPVLIGGYAKNSAPTPSVADGDMVRAWFDPNGIQYVRFDTTPNVQISTNVSTTPQAFDDSQDASGLLAGTFVSGNNANYAILWSNPRNSSGTEIASATTTPGASDLGLVVRTAGTVTVTGTGGTFPVTDSGGSLTVDAPVGTPAFVRLSDGAAAITTLPVSLTSTTITGTVTVDTELPTAAALADATANPTTTSVGALGLLFNGTTWDRKRSAVAGMNSVGTGIQASAIVAQLDDTGTTAVTENQFAHVRLSTRRALLVEGVASGTAIPISGTVSVTGYPSAAASADALANPTVTKIDSTNLLFNGTTWDRARGMSGNLTTGDTGAKTATGNGATVANVGNKGVQIVLALGVVSGTLPTLVLKVQGSADGGSNWVDIPGATTGTITTTGVFGISIYPGITVTAGVNTTGTTATAAGALPRAWRVVWTIGGTLPSFAFTSVNYNYLPN